MARPIYFSEINPNIIIFNKLVFLTQKKGMSSLPFIGVETPQNASLIKR
jgi:hypothetical protein